MTTRRRFIQTLGHGATALALPYINHLSRQQTQKLGIALVGLGSYSTNQVAPALQETRYCRLAGVVTGTPEKEQQWADKYGLSRRSIYNYQNYDEIASNSMHAEFTIRGAIAGKHVICEKPMANTVQECLDMIAACERNNVLMQIGYRLLYEPNNQAMERLCRQKELGEIRAIESSNAFYAGDNWDNWRFHQALSGGGPLMDMGVYSVHGVRHAAGMEPVAITAQTYNVRTHKFTDVEETIHWQMEFPNGLIANCMSSYSARAGHLLVHGDTGNARLEPAFGYGPLKLLVKGVDQELPHTNHQAVQLDAFARNIIDGTPVVASSREGLNDMIVIEAIYEAARTGNRIKIVGR